MTLLPALARKRGGKTMTEEKGERRIGQRRIEERTDCDIEARIELSDRLAIACRIKDLSTEGFKVQVNETIHLPDELDLLIPVIEGTFQRYRVQGGLAEGGYVGRRFVPHSLSEMPK